MQVSVTVSWAYMNILRGAAMRLKRSGDAQVLQVCTCRALPRQERIRHPEREAPAMLQDVKSCVTAHGRARSAEGPPSMTWVSSTRQCDCCVLCATLAVPSLHNTGMRDRSGCSCLILLGSVWTLLAVYDSVKHQQCLLSVWVQ